MSEALDQAEIDALLSSLAAESDPSPSGAPAGGIAPQQSTVSGRQPEAKTYDFTRPEPVSKDHIHALSSIHEVFAGNFGATLSGCLRTIIDVRLVGVEQLTYNEFIRSLPNPTCFMILQAPPLEGQMCMEISPLIVFPILDRLMGGNTTSMLMPQRPLTSIEWRLITRLIERALGHLSEVWRNLVEAEFQMVETESNPQLVHIVAPTEVVVCITFEIKLGQHAGAMSFCIPYTVIESVLSHLTTQSWFYRPKAASEVQVRRLLRNLSKSTVDVTAYLGQTTIKLSEFRGLRAGDLIQLNKPVTQDAVIQVGGRNKFAGSIGRLRGRRALRLSRHAQIDEPL